MLLEEVCCRCCSVVVVEVVVEVGDTVTDVGSGDGGGRLRSTPFLRIILPPSLLGECWELGVHGPPRVVLVSGIGGCVWDVVVVVPGEIGTEYVLMPFIELLMSRMLLQ